MLNYRGLRAVREHLTVTDAQVDRQMENLLENRMKIIEVTDRPAQVDDELVLDYVGETDGNSFAGGTAQNQTLVLGSGMFIAGFEEQLIGRRAGEQVDVHVRFPDAYHAPQLAGKDAVFHCTIHQIRLKERYRPDDTFAREVGGCSSYSQFRENIRRALQDYADAQSEAEVKESLLNQVCDSAQFEPAQDRIDAALELEMRSLERQLARQGLNLEQYLHFMNKTRAQLRQDCLPSARRNVERQMAVAEIARIEGICADEAGIARKLSEICEENNLSLEQLQGQMDEAFQAAVTQSVVTDKVLDFLMAQARVETVEAGH